MTPWISEAQLDDLLGAEAKRPPGRAFDTTKFFARIRLNDQGINTRSLVHRRPHPRRIALRPWPTVPLEPKDFVRRLAATLGSDSAKWLTINALRIVEDTGEPERWIRAVQRARHRGTLSPAVAHFLIWELARSAMMQWNSGHPLLAPLSAELQRRRHEFELGDGECWDLDEGPAEWQKLYDEWEEMFFKLFMFMLLGNGEHEIVEAYFREEDQVYREGRCQVFGF